MWGLNRKALTLLEVVASITILTIVLMTYGSATEGKRRILYELKIKSLYNRLAYTQLERMIAFVQQNKQIGKTYYSTAKSAVSTSSFFDYTQVFSHEGKPGKLDADNGLGARPRIPLLQLEVHGTDYGSNYSDVNSYQRFLSFPYPNELKAGYTNPWPEVSDSNGTFHHITSFLNQGVNRKYRAVLPLVSEEFLMPDGAGGRKELGFGAAGALSAEDIQLAAGLQLFISPVSIGQWKHERIRRYVYYRKIREGNLVFSENVKGVGSQAVDDLMGKDSTAVQKTTNIDMLYIQNLNDWTLANGSSSEGGVTGILGTAYPNSVGGTGSHSILLMVVVRALNPEVADNLGSSEMEDADFLSQSKIKAVAMGIASPAYGKNLLKTMDLSYHRYAWSRVPGLKQVFQ